MNYRGSDEFIWSQTEVFQRHKGHCYERKKTLSTGPKTIAGKAIASKNAQKAAIFTKGYLPSEDTAAKQVQFDALSAQWGANDPSRQLIMRTIEQASLGLERLMHVERERMVAAMQSLDIAKEFAIQAGFDVVRYVNIPHWYFKEAHHPEKDRALTLCAVLEEAKHLREHFSDTLAPQIAQLYPHLYAYVMQSQVPSASFLQVLGLRYKQSAPTLNLAAFINLIAERYPDHLKWAADPERFQGIIDGIRYGQMLGAMDLEKSNRYATSFQNRILKGFQALQALDEIEARKRERAYRLSCSVEPEVMLESSKNEANRE